AYTSACSSLISSFQMQERALQSKGILTGPDSVPKFMREFGLDATRAQLRLLEDRVPATAKYTTATHEYKPSHVHETTSLYITVRDALVMGMTAKDRLYPHLTALMTSLQRHAMLPADHPSKATLSPWLSRLNAMDASDELSESQARTMALDVQQSNSAFEEALEGTS
ncbi:Vps28, partial [Symbiodinium sp. KB8]